MRKNLDVSPFLTPPEPETSLDFVVHAPTCRTEESAVRRHPRSLPALAAVAAAICSTPAAPAAPLPPPPAPQAEFLTHRRAADMLATSDSLGDELARRLANTLGERTPSRLDDAVDIMAAPSEWRWYSRDHGILLAIPVRERLPIGTKRASEDAIADSLRRLANEQGYRNPPVQVVLIEPEIPCPSPRFRAVVGQGWNSGSGESGGGAGAGFGGGDAAGGAATCGCN